MEICLPWQCHGKILQTSDKLTNHSLAWICLRIAPFLVPVQLPLQALPLAPLSVWNNNSTVHNGGSTDNKPVMKAFIQAMQFRTKSVLHTSPMWHQNFHVLSVTMTPLFDCSVCMFHCWQWRCSPMVSTFKAVPMMWVSFANMDNHKNSAHSEKTALSKTHLQGQNISSTNKA